jgi:D-amino peptidase
VKEYLIAVDLEGVHGTVGEPYGKLSKDAAPYPAAVEAAEAEVNTVARTLFACGADRVVVWDNHGGGGNLRRERLDPRIEAADTKGNAYRMDFVKNYNFAGALFVGYHAMEGTPNGVLAHTFNSTAIQYAKLDGVPIGELGVDSYILDSYGVPSLFLSSDDVCIREMRTMYPSIYAVTTKYGKGRNRAELLSRETVLAAMEKTVRAAVCEPVAYTPRPFPTGAVLEVRHTRAEHAEEMFLRLKDTDIPATYGEDTHTLLAPIQHPKQMPKML